MVALSIFLDEMLVENWSFSGYKSDFKADQKIRKAMFSIREGSRLIRTDLLLILNPFSSQSSATLVPNLPIYRSGIGW